MQDFRKALEASGADDTAAMRRFPGNEPIDRLFLAMPPRTEEKQAAPPARRRRAAAGRGRVKTLLSLLKEGGCA